MLASTYQYPILDFFLTMLYFFLFIIWIWLLITVFVDVFRSRDMGGGAKALWCIFVIILPFLGVFVYLIARGGKMHERAAEQAAEQQKAFDAYVKQTAGAAAERRRGSRPTVEARRPQGEGGHHRRRVRGAEIQGPRLELSRRRERPLNRTRPRNDRGDTP